MTGGTAIVAGATGMVGARLTEQLAASGWNVIGLCRRPPTGAGAGAVRYLAVALDDARDCRTKLGALSETTHIFYAARAAHGEGSVEPIDENLTMLRNLVDTVAAVAPDLRHVHLVHGGKYYGSHLGHYKTPAREDDPRHMPPNFYFLQQDYVAGQAGRWAWTVSRPSIVSDFTPGRGRNLSSLIASYALISRHLGVPLRFPGTDRAYGAVTECTDAAHLARAIIWMATAPDCANRAVNVTNGDCYRWRNLWPGFAAAFDLPIGPPQRIRLSEFMADKAEVWSDIVAAHGLEPTPMDDVAQWAYGDFIFGTEHDVLTDTTRLRQSGFHDVVDSEAMFLDHFDRYRAVGIIP